MESRKYQLQKQILEAQKSNDIDLYSLLKSQWAHRFGVESLEELKNLDLNQLNQNSNNLNNQKIDFSKENYFEGDKAINVKVDDDKEKDIKTKKLESIEDKSDEALKMKSYEIAGKKSDENKAIKPFKDNKNMPQVEVLIPLPPKPKYSYLRKWLLGK